MENWKYINGTDHYMISDLGNVKSLKFGKEKNLSNQKDGRGYYFVFLSINGKRIKSKIHQLVWITFNGDYRTGSTKGLVLNHINKNKLDNRLSNLELISNIENVNYSLDKSKLTSKYPNVSFHKERKKWMARGDIKGTPRKYIGLFETELEAYEAFQKVKEEAER